MQGLTHTVHAVSTHVSSAAGRLQASVEGAVDAVSQARQKMEYADCALRREALQARLAALPPDATQSASQPMVSDPLAALDQCPFAFGPRNPLNILWRHSQACEYAESAVRREAVLAAQPAAVS